MQMTKRIVLFVLTNILIVATISIVTSLLGITPYLTANGLNLESLAALCAVWGFGGAFISLLLSRVMAKMMMGVQVVPVDTRDAGMRWLVDTVHRHAKRAGITKMPEVGIYQSPQLNAFATGPTKNRSLVAVSTGLLNYMNKDEAEGVIGHEVAHIANGDMVTMTLVQGTVNAFVMFFARIIAYFLTQSGNSNDERPNPMAQYWVAMLIEIALGFLSMPIIAWFSRQREFRADKGGAELAGKEKMVAALQALKRNFELPESAHPAVETLQISGKAKKGGFIHLFSTHPPLELRIERLMRARIA